jgi:hypothetical protein
MINAQLLPDGVLIVSPTGELQAVDFERMRLLTDPYIDEHGDLKGLLIDAESFPSWENFSSMLSHIRFVRDYQEKIERVAAVTDNGFLAILPMVADHFVAAEVRHYDYQDRDRALTWLSTGLDPG